MTDEQTQPQQDEPAIVLPACPIAVGWKEYWRGLDLDAAMCLALVSKLHGKTPKDIIEEVLSRGALHVPMSNFQGLELPSELTS